MSGGRDGVGVGDKKRPRATGREGPLVIATIIYLALSNPFPGAELWTGIKKGPPRKLKFPEPQEVVKELKKYLS